MRKPEIDHILTTMLESFGNISDLNITVGKPFQVETSGQLTEVPMHPPIKMITPFQSEVFALNLIGTDRPRFNTGPLPLASAPWQIWQLTRKRSAPVLVTVDAVGG